jgi:hypothetical protein
MRFCVFPLLEVLLTAMPCVLCFVSIRDLHRPLLQKNIQSDKDEWKSFVVLNLLITKNKTQYVSNL